MSLFSDIVFRLTQPLLLGQLLRFFREDPQISNAQALWCAGGILAIIGCNTILMNQIFITAFHSGMQIRVAICSVVYRKVNEFSYLQMKAKRPILLCLFQKIGIATVTNSTW